MTREEFKKNLKEALWQDNYDLGDVALGWIADIVEDHKNWTYKTFSDFASSVCNEWGDYFEVLRDWGYITRPTSNLETERLTREWLYDHEGCDAYNDILSYCETKDVEELNIGDVEEWMREEGHEQAYRDVLSYIKRSISR